MVVVVEPSGFFWVVVTVPEEELPPEEDPEELPEDPLPEDPPPEDPPVAGIASRAIS